MARGKPKTPTEPDKPTGPDMTIVMVPVADIIRDTKNARQHSDDQVTQLVRSVQAFGWTIPVLVDEANKLIAGHGRLLAADRLEMATVPAIVARGWTEAQKRAYALADNKLTENATWDKSLLREAFADLDGFDLTLTGFSASEIDALFEGNDILDVREIDVGPVQVRFWISVTGPLDQQANALDRLKKTMADLPGVAVEMGTIADAV